MSLLLVQGNCELLKVAEQNKNSYGDQTIVPEAKPFWVNANFDEEHLDSSHVVAKSLVGYNFLKITSKTRFYKLPAEETS